MCGRYNLVPDAEALLAAFEIALHPDIIIEVEPNYNVCPSMDIPAVRIEHGMRAACLLRWVLLPSWSKEKQSGCNELNSVMGKINERYGEFTLASGNFLNHSDMPNVIAPAWKPYGQTI